MHAPPLPDGFFSVLVCSYLMIRVVCVCFFERGKKEGEQQAEREAESGPTRPFATPDCYAVDLRVFLPFQNAALVALICFCV